MDYYQNWHASDVKDLSICPSICIRSFYFVQNMQIQRQWNRTARPKSALTPALKFSDILVTINSI